MPVFKNFPLINYKFGDEKTTSIFTNLTAYVDVIDQLKDDGAFYEYYDIIDGDRPDIVSYKLYGTTDYYWTFYLLNENLRTQGWPLTEQELALEGPEYYPHNILTTEEEMYNYFKVGQTVLTYNDNFSQEEIENNVATGAAFFNNYDGIGKIIERDLNLGQVVIEADTGVKDITITNAGAGYYRSPTVTITDGEGTGATASVTVDSLGFISDIELISRGSGYSSVPTVRISEPDLIDWSAYADTLNEYVSNGGALGTYLVDSNYIKLVEFNVDGYLLGDINNDGQVDSDDIKIIDDYVLNPNSISALNKTWLEKITKPEIIAKSSFLGNLFPGNEYAKSTAIATASIVNADNDFDAAKWMFTEDDTYETNPGLWTPNDVRWNAVLKSRDQLEAIHHWEDDDGNWVDIDPFNQSGPNSSTAGYNSITYKDRLESKNEELKSIKVFRPSVVEQVYAEFNKALRNNRNG